MQKAFVKAYQTAHHFLTQKGIRYPFLKKINGLIIKKLRSPVVKIEGHIIHLDPEDSLRLSTRGYYEPFVIDIAQKYLKQGDIVLDIGANIGYFTLTFAKIVGPTGKVYAFEPNSENMNILKKNVEVNGYTNVIFIEKAVSNKNGKLRLYLSDDSSTRHSVHKNEYCGSSFIEIDAVKLDDFFDVGQKVHFIKLDVEGAEFDALQGMSRLLGDNEKISMITEFTPTFLQNVNVNPGIFIDFLQKEGFQIYHANNGDPFVLEKVDEYVKKGGKVNTDLLCLKGK